MTVLEFCKTQEEVIFKNEETGATATVTNIHSEVSEWNGKETHKCTWMKREMYLDVAVNALTVRGFTIIN